MPAALGPDKHVWIGVDGDRVGMRVELRNHFDVVVIREHEFLTSGKRLEPEAAPEVYQPLLGVAVDATVALDPTELDRRARHMERQPRVPELALHRDPFQLREIGKEADA